MTLLLRMLNVVSLKLPSCSPNRKKAERSGIRIRDPVAAGAKGDLFARRGLDFCEYLCLAQLVGLSKDIDRWRPLNLCIMAYTPSGCPMTGGALFPSQGGDGAFPIAATPDGLGTWNSVRARSRTVL